MYPGPRPASSSPSSPAADAAAADLRHVQGALLEWTGGSFRYDTPHEEYLASVGTEVAHAVGELVDRLEGELGTWPGGT